MIQRLIERGLGRGANVACQCGHFVLCHILSWPLAGHWLATGWPLAGHWPGAVQAGSRADKDTHAARTVPVVALAALAALQMQGSSSNATRIY
jgi:hypothetical protein